MTQSATVSVACIFLSLALSVSLSCTTAEVRSGGRPGDGKSTPRTLASPGAASPIVSDEGAPSTAVQPTLSDAATLRDQRTAVRQSSPWPCPVTVPNGNHPPKERPSPSHHGNGALWTVLTNDGKVLIMPQDVRPDGSLRMKLPWWRGPGAEGELTIQGRRLDASAAPLGSDIPFGYGNTGVQATDLRFPTEGCWEVTGRAGESQLTFVTLVVRDGEPK